MVGRVYILLLLLQIGCAASQQARITSDSLPSSINDAVVELDDQAVSPAEASEEPVHDKTVLASEETHTETAETPDSLLVSFQSASDESTAALPVEPELNPAVSLDAVIDSVHLSYPLVRAAYQERQIANGNQLSAWGAFDTKLKAASENGPLGYYETYRNSAGFSTPIYGGGEFFGGYRNGGGDFQPWYKERETNDGGEFKGGVRVPLIRDRDIDARRAEVWRSTYDQQIADPVIRASLVQFTREAGLAYWKWVAAGHKYRLGRRWVELAKDRNDRIQIRVDRGDLDPPELIDNQRAIAKREAKLAAALLDFQQASAKLSLFLRDANGRPIVLSDAALPEFPALRDLTLAQLDADINRAQQSRPELLTLELQLQRLRVDYSEACNLTLPGLDAQLSGSQDVGEPTSKTRDKSEFELEAALFFDVPLQRRKGRGKMAAVQAKMSQVAAKRQMVQDKVAAEMQSVYAGLIQSRQEVLKAREAVRLATRMAEIELRKFEVGQSDLLKVALREQYALEAAEEEISATYNHFSAFSDYAAVLAVDRPVLDLLPE